MNNTKKTLLISGIICLISGLFSVLALLMDVFETQIQVYAVVLDSLNVALSLTTGII